MSQENFSILTSIMLQDIAFAFWFLLPAAVANMVPVFSAALPGLKNWTAPIDGGRTFRGHALLGPHKTWRGLLSGMVAATFVLWVQQLAYTHSEWAQFAAGSVDYALLPTLILGPLFAIGALGGDAVESFFKRQRGIKSGGAWIPFDQIDYILGAIVVSLFVVIASPSEYLWMILVWFVMHLLVSYIGWLLGLKKDPI